MRGRVPSQTIAGKAQRQPALETDARRLTQTHAGGIRRCLIRPFCRHREVNQPATTFSPAHLARLDFDQPDVPTCPIASRAREQNFRRLPDQMPVQHSGPGAIGVTDQRIGVGNRFRPLQKPTNRSHRQIGTECDLRTGREMRDPLARVRVESANDRVRGDVRHRLWFPAGTSEMAT